MRIISGFLKGKKIKFLKNSTTRPLKDSVKENIFNILKHSNFINVKIENSSVVDIYSGIGSFGLECISRGAKKVAFIEKDNLALNILSENLNALSVTKKAKIFGGEVEKFLSRKFDEKFDIFFFDPPFKDLNFIKSLNLIKKKEIYKTSHILIIHREKNSSDNYGNLIKIVNTKSYGRSKIIFANFY